MSTPLEALKEAARRILEDTGARFDPPVAYVSQERFDAMLKAGWIMPDGRPTGKWVHSPWRVETEDHPSTVQGGTVEPTADLDARLNAIRERLNGSTYSRINYYVDDVEFLLKCVDELRGPVCIWQYVPPDEATAKAFQEAMAKHSQQPHGVFEYPASGVGEARYTPPRRELDKAAKIINQMNDSVRFPAKKTFRWTGTAADFLRPLETNPGLRLADALVQAYGDTLEVAFTDWPDVETRGGAYSKGELPVLGIVGIKSELLWGWDHADGHPRRFAKEIIALLTAEWPSVRQWALPEDDKTPHGHDYRCSVVMKGEVHVGDLLVYDEDGCYRRARPDEQPEARAMRVPDGNGLGTALFIDHDAPDEPIRVDAKE